MKVAIVKPLLKKDNADETDMKNYRPVCNLSMISKLLEKLVSVQITAYLESQSLLPTCQSAYRAAHSRETALLRIHSDLVAAADAGRISLVAFLDMSAAFDCVDHSILIKRLSTEFGMANSVTDWVASYLSDRQQIIRCADNLSSHIH